MGRGVYSRRDTKLTMDIVMNESRLEHSRSQGLIDFAFRFAKEAHGTQRRKYTNEPYIIHPVAVAHIVATVTEDCEMWCAALLHDTIEDTHITYEVIRDSGFGVRIADLVKELTDASLSTDGNRAMRKAVDRAYLETVSARAQTIKLADLIHNTESIVKYDVNFAKVYMREKQLLLGVLTRGDSELQDRANQLVTDYYLGRIGHSRR